MLGVCDLTVKRWIDSGELPKPTIGGKGAKIQAWHESVLKLDAIRKFSIDKNVGCPDQVRGQDMDVRVLGDLDRAMAQELADQLYRQAAV